MLIPEQSNYNSSKHSNISSKQRIASNSLHGWWEWVHARETFCGEGANSLTAREFSQAAKPRADSTRFLPILLATYVAFCTRVRDRSSRGYPLTLATQATQVKVTEVSKVTKMVKYSGITILGYNLNTIYEVLTTYD